MTWGLAARRLAKKAAGAALAASLATAPTLADESHDVAKLFGLRVQADSRFSTPYAVGDFDGDGRPDFLFLVTVLPATAQNGLDSGVKVVGMLFGRQPLGARPETLALAILQDGGKKKFLLTGYQGDGTTDYFSSPIWSGASAPVQIAKPGSEIFNELQRQEPRIKYDIIVVGTEAGIDTALYWTGSSYALFQPVEEP